MIELPKAADGRSLGKLELFVVSSKWAYADSAASAPSRVT
jgi:hypothetical protein